MLADLPSLPIEPHGFADCCLSISKPLLQRIHHLVPSKPGLVLSIGCGTGLLEALLQDQYEDLLIEGVEVPSASMLTQYLPTDSLNTVSGTWDLCSRAQEARVWMFVYPREPKLLKKYVENYGTGAVDTVIWLGPIVDWPDYEAIWTNSPREGWKIHETLRGAAAGLVDYEMMAVIKISTEIV